MEKHNVLIIIKKMFLWRYIAPVFLFLVGMVWRLSYGLKPSLMYFFSVRGKKDGELSKKGLRIVRSDSHFSNFAEWLAGRIPEGLIVSEIEKMKSTNEPKNYMTDLSPLLDDETKFEILKFALDDENIQAVCGYLKFLPRLATAKVILNRPVDGAALGPQRWHRDWFSYRGMNIFTALTDVDEETGIYSAIGLDIIPRYSEIPVYDNDPNVELYDRDRVSDASMLEFVDKKSFEYIKGSPGTTALVDSGWVYHKGGHLKRDYRLMLEISYLAEQKPTISRPPNILEYLGLEEHEGLQSILNNPVRRYMVRGFTKKQGGGVFFHWLSRKLTYYKSKTKNDVLFDSSMNGGEQKSS